MLFWNPSNEVLAKRIFFKKTYKFHYFPQKWMTSH